MRVGAAAPSRFALVVSPSTLASAWMEISVTSLAAHPNNLP